MSKIISEYCELVKLSDIDCSGPVLLRHAACIFTPLTSVISCEDRCTCSKDRIDVS